MASATSDISKVTTYTGNAQQRRKGTGPRETNYYNSQVTTLADGSVKRETYRVDAKGNNAVKISESTSDKNGKIVSEKTLSTATAAERKALQDPKSRFKNIL